MLSGAIERLGGGPTGNSRRLLFFAGLSLAVLAFVLLLGLGLAAVGRTGTSGEVGVVTAARDIGQREVLSADALTISQLPQSAVPPGALLRVSDARDSVALVPILKGQTITANLIAAVADQIASAGSAYLPIPHGFVARALPTNEQQGVAGYIAAGDYINVAATVQTNTFVVNSPQNPNRIVTKTVFTDLYVIRVGPEQQQTSRIGAAQGVFDSITVVMTECDAEIADWFINSGARLTYFLLSYKDYASPPTSPDPSCPSATASNGALGPAQIDARFGFTKT
jgi:Flp pilus assembly protein CpaB